MPDTRLRQIALTVSEPDPGCFQWEVLECPGRRPEFTVSLATSPTTFPSYSQALREGEAFLIALAARSPAGPRTHVDFLTASHARAGASTARNAHHEGA